MESANNNFSLVAVLQWAWVTLFALVVSQWRKINGHETRLALVEQAQENAEKQYEIHRSEQRERNEKIFEKLEDIRKDVSKLAAKRKD